MSALADHDLRQLKAALRSCEVLLGLCQCLLTDATERLALLTLAIEKRDA